MTSNWLRPGAAVLCGIAACLTAATVHAKEDTHAYTKPGPGDRGADGAQGLATLAQAEETPPSTTEITSQPGDTASTSQGPSTVVVEEAPKKPTGPKDDTKEAKDAAEPTFIKGEIIHVGTTRMLSRYDHFGVALGAQVINSKAFLAVDPGLAIYADGWATALHIPLNLLAVEPVGTTVEYGGMLIRSEDWDERADFTKVIRFFTMGSKESNFYFSLNSMRPASIGHGMLMENYQPNIDVDRSMTNVLFDAYNEYAGFELQLNDVTVDNRIVGALGFLKPLSFISDHPMARTFSIGVEYAADFRAPLCVRMNANDDQCVQGMGHAAGRDPFTGERLNRSFVNTDPDTGRYAVTETTVQAAGVSTEVKLYKDGRYSDIKLYGTYHQFLNEGGGSGAASGFLGRFNAGTRWIQAFRLRMEYRNMGDGFLPNYFDTLYEVGKYEHAVNQHAYQVTPTKYQAIFGDPGNQFERPNNGRRHGFRVDLNWGLFFKRKRYKQIALGIGVYDSEGPFDSNMYMHVEFPAWGWLQLFASYLRVNAESFADLLDAGLFQADDGVLLTGFRLQILPILFLNAHYSRSLSVVRSAGQEYHLGNRTIGGADRDPSLPPTSRLFENRETLLVTIELGYEFDYDDDGAEEEEN